MSFDKINGLYRDAYHWVPPDIGVGERLTTKSMRQYVKSWITTWDIERLYGEIPVIETGTIATNYDENIDMERAPAPSDRDDSDA